MNLFGKKKTPAAARTSTTADSAAVIQRLRVAIDQLDKREEHLGRKIDEQIAQARARAAKKDRKGALFCLKHKGLFEKEVAKIAGARFTLTQQVIALEGSISNMETIAVMEAGRNAMAANRGTTDADDVGEIMDDIREEMDVADEISNAIGTPLDDPLEDDDLLKELEELENLDLEQQLLDQPVAAPPPPAAAVPAAAAAAAPAAVPPAPPIALPAAPDSNIQISGDIEDEDEKALRELEASMALMA